tara:strand:+ start:1944 stop:2366 length:423 start_codon:yes stop_codon:yes gene_type:complete
MRIYLSPKKPNDQSCQWISNLVTLGGQVLDHEASNVVADQFLSQFSYHEIETVIQQIVTKTRMNGEITFIEVDMNLLAQKYIRDDVSLEDINKLLCAGKSIKSMINMKILQEMIGTKLTIAEKHFDEVSSTIILKARRVS